jgi:MarR-like DNA-binding transcriptional regulator SgrR of sgrS sRNA
MNAYAKLGKKLVLKGWIIPIMHEHQQVQAAQHIAGLRMSLLGFPAFSDFWVRREP